MTNDLKQLAGDLVEECERQIEAAVMEEREACAAIAHVEVNESGGMDNAEASGYEMACEEIEQKIRSRGAK